MITPLEASGAISDNKTGHTTDTIPTPRPRINRPMNRAVKLPEAAIAEPTMKNKLLASMVSLRPYFSAG